LAVSKDEVLIKFLEIMSSNDRHVPTQAEIEAQIFVLLAMRRNGATICPSEVARALDNANWRELMPQIRKVAQGLAKDDRLQVTRGGVLVDALSLGGPIRIGRVPTRLTALPRD
jgi:hypothetical protein